MLNHTEPARWELEILMVGDDVPDVSAFFPPRPAWQRQAACRGEDTAAFFPGRGARTDAEKAKAVCAQCPV